MKDPTRLAAIKALKPTPGPVMIEPMNDGETYQLTTCEDTGFTVICETESGEPQDLRNMEFVRESFDPEYGLQALAAEVERLQEPVKVAGMIESPHSISAKHDGCHVFSFAGLRPAYCPNCGRRLEWK